VTTTTARQPLRARWRVLLLAALAAVLALVLPTGTASASGVPAPQARVGAIQPTVTTVVGVAEHIAAGQRRSRAPSQLQLVSGHCVAAEGAATAATRLEFQVGTKIEKQMVGRGWSKDSIDDLINNPARTVTTRDTRWTPTGTRMDDPATGFINRDGSYVVRSDVTGDIVQVSNRLDPNWKSLW